MNNNLFFSKSDKYELVATLGTGSFGTVYLVRHRILECFRAIKVIPKSRAFTDSILSEARLLKSLNHSGIPTIYEIEEDNSYYYLIEEYMDGETLEEFLLNQKHISHNTFYYFCTQICEIFCYLHNFRPDPILYMDLKPEHIIVCQMELKLIDFNVSVSLSNTGNLCNLYGNHVYSAPEIKKGTKPNPQWDIYGIGKIMLYMSHFVDTPLPHKFQKILKKATAQNPAYRYETVDELKLAIAKEQNYSRQEHSCKTIAVIGSNPGCGTAHISIALVSVLNYLGYPACYYETRKKNNLHVLKAFLPGMKETDGCLHYKYFYGYPNYGPGIYLPKDSSKIRVMDFGSSYNRNNRDLLEADLLLFICGSGVWNWQNVFDKGETFLNTHGNVKFVCNLGTHKPLHVYAQKFHRPIYSYSYDPNPFQITKDKCQLFTHILQLKRRNYLFFHLKRLLFRKKS